MVRAVTLRGGSGGRKVGVAEGLEGTEGGVLGEGLFDHGNGLGGGADLTGFVGTTRPLGRSNGEQHIW